MSASAIRTAVDLLHVPSRVPYLRREPLPDDVLTVLRILAGDEELTRAMAITLERPPGLLREAAAFYVEQILLAPTSDSYRMLGADAAAAPQELRRNMALLLKWLHPDMRHGHSIYAHRVITAWESVKSPERRRAHDRTHPASNGAKPKPPRRIGRGKSTSPRLHRLAGEPTFLRRALIRLESGLRRWAVGRVRTP